MEARIVEYDRLVGEPESFRGACIRLRAISTPNIDVQDVVTALRYSEAHPLNVRFGISQRDVHEKCPVTCVPGDAHNGHRPVACERCFQREALQSHEQRLTAEDRLTSRRNSGASRMSCIHAPGDRVGVD